MENPNDGTERNHMENPDDCTERHHMENPDDGRDAFRVHHAHFEKKNGHWPWYITPIAK
jgi:hypothetical protein